MPYSEVVNIAQGPGEILAYAASGSGAAQNVDITPGVNAYVLLKGLFVAWDDTPAAGVTVEIESPAGTTQLLYTAEADAINAQGQPINFGNGIAFAVGQVVRIAVSASTGDVSHVTVWGNIVQDFGAKQKVLTQ